MKIMMMGTREEELAGVMEPPSTSVDVVNDFDIEDDEIAIQDRYTVHASGISMELFSGQRIIFTHFTKSRIGWCPPKKHCPYRWGHSDHTDHPRPCRFDMRGDQKVLQLGYKKLTHAVIF